LWRDRAGGEVLLGLGAAQDFASLTECRVALQDMQAQELAPRAFSVVAFDVRAPLLPPWEEFSPSRYVLPEILVRWRDGQATVAILSKRDGRDDAGLLRMLEDPPPPTVPMVVDGARTFSKTEWMKAVQEIRVQIAAGAVSKVVLARDSVRITSSPLCAGFVLEELASSAKDCYLFAHRSGSSTFLGASPERLFRLEGNAVETESLAGTRPRGKSAEEDERLAQELLQSAKDSGEQNIVTQFIRQALTGLCVTVSDDPEPNVRKLAALQHLQTRLHGELKEDVTPDDVLRALHPTPAVCGMPRDAAREMIAELEPTPRGLYAGAIGWIEAERAEFAVAIRSALLRENIARVFAGAGIVADSDARAEWKETALKMRPMLAALNCEEL